MTRDQHRALHAYGRVDALLAAHGPGEDYKTLVQGFGATVLRSGLAAALATLEREISRDTGHGHAAPQTPAATFLADLASANLLGVGQCNGQSLPGRVRDLAVSDYMLATRDVLKLVQWFKRAVEARISG